MCVHARALTHLRVQSMSKIVKAKGPNGQPLPISEFEARVSQEILNLQNAPANEDIKSQLEALHIMSAQQVKLDSGKESIVVTVPFKLLKQFHQIQQRLVRELEKKFSGQYVVIVAARKIVPAKGRGRAKIGMRPRSRTLTAVHEATLSDIVFPTEIVGKRVRVSQDGNKLLKVLLDPKDQVTLETKLETFQKVYRTLTKKTVAFEFPTLDA